MIDVYVSDVIDAPVDKVWPLLRDFARPAVWFPAIESERQLNPELGSEVGAIRALRIKGVPGEGQEELVALSEADRTFSYRLIKTEAPIADYISEVRLVGVTRNESTFISWHSRFNSPAGQEREMAELTKGIIIGGIDALAHHLRGAALS